MIKLNKYLWDEVKLDKLCHDIEYGITASAMEDGNTYMLRITDINENGKLNKDLKYISVDDNTFSKYKLKANNVLIARSGATAGKPYIHKSIDRFVFASYLLRIRLNEEKIFPDYFFCFLNSSNYLKQLNGIKVGSAQPNVNTTNLRTLKVPLPSKDEQILIAELFRSIEKAIEESEDQGKNLKALQKLLINGLVSETPIFGNLIVADRYSPSVFGNMADCIEEHDKQKKDVERFIGLEHIESENLNISTWGDISNGTTFTKRFRKGDVLFGKRRAYLKKSAIADFDGICSGDILVLRAKEDKILPKLLPFYVSADSFMQHAVNTSAGSLSPRTKWKDLAGFKIGLPDKDVQQKILEVFLHIQGTLNNINIQITTLKNLKQKLLNEILG